MGVGMSNPEPSGRPPAARRNFLGTYVRVFAPVILFGSALCGLVAYSLDQQRRAWERSDQANLREWLNESRVFRDTLPELARSYIDDRLEYESLQANAPAGAPVSQEWKQVALKQQQIAEHLQALAEPVRMYQGQLLLFPEMYRIELGFHIPGRSWEPIVWESPVPAPRARTADSGGVRVYTYHPLGAADPRAVLTCTYQLHTYNKQQRDEAEAQRRWRLLAGIVAAAGVIGVGWVYYFLRRERQRELSELATAAAIEHAEKEQLANRLRIQEVEMHREELERQLLQRSLEAAQQEGRAAAAERSALELKSQLYASIGIMAGSYAHNIKNLLVRPNDLLVRCMETDGLPREQTSMLQEVRQTLGTVTERLQQILRTVRSDPGRAEVTGIDLNDLVVEMHRTWSEMGREKWKLTLTAQPWPEPVPVRGDHSHLQQAAENLLFNARDATFEMRNHLRESARKTGHTDGPSRKQALIDAASWKGQVRLSAYRRGDKSILEVADNGIGMSEEVRRKCVETHFSTKRNNALYEGYNAGMGLGLSFVVVILEHHKATLDIESEPLHGTTFRMVFPAGTGRAG
jgi:signal transduction histidine kinase